MKIASLTTFLVILLLFGCTNGQIRSDLTTEKQQNKAMSNFQFTLESAHPNARSLMTDEFYFSSIEETGPFGSDDGFDAAYGFREWRLLNKTTSPERYLKDLIESWHYPFFDYHEMDTSKIKEYINQRMELSESDMQQQINILKEMSKNSPDTSKKELDDQQLSEMIISSSQGMNGIYLLGQDNAIIGIGFAQFVLEGRIDEDFKSLTIIAIRRQLLPLMINRYDDNYRKLRKRQLTKMLDVINKSPS